MMLKGCIYSLCALKLNSCKQKKKKSKLEKVCCQFDLNRVSLLRLAVQAFDEKAREASTL